MPYSDIRDLPAAQVARYSVEQKRAFLKAFNEAYQRYGGDEHRAFATAHSAAQRTRGPGAKSKREEEPRADR